MAARVAEMPSAHFRLLVLGIAAAASVLAAEGVQTFAQLAERRAVTLARRGAASPVPYGAAVAALHVLAPPAEGRPRVLVRADSAGAGAAALCALAGEAANAPDLRWVALSPAVEPCAARAAGPALLRAGAPGAAEMAGARWIVLDARGASLYSGRAVPSAARMRTIVSLVDPGAGPEPRG